MTLTWPSVCSPALSLLSKMRSDARMAYSSRWRLGHKVARFLQVNKGRSNVHHDALEFPDGRSVLLTQLCKGQHATVLQLPVTSPVTANEARRHGSPVA